MSSLDRNLDDDFAELRERLTGPAALSASRTDPIYYFVYPPDQAIEVKRKIPLWAVQLGSRGRRVTTVSFAEMLWELVDASGAWDEWLAVEGGFDTAEINESIRSVLRGENGLIEKIAARIDQATPDSVLFLTDTELAHPYFRVRTLESALHDRVKVPTVVFYPGRRVGQFGLSFLGFYPDDGNYRATLIGGMP